MERSRPTRQCTLAILVSNNMILLGMKKKGFGLGKYNGYGGKVESGETIEQAALREFTEESHLQTSSRDLSKMGEIDFYFPHRPEFNQTVHIYRVKRFSGIPQETDEMSHHWFDLDKIPYSSMWDGDKHWLPLVLQGKKVRGHFVFKELNQENVVDKKNLEIMTS